jgi:Xaa-Pro aminopeptidase
MFKIAKINKNTSKIYNYSIFQINSYFSKKATNEVKSCSGKVEELGQPTYWTHPHLFTTSNSAVFNKQVTPGITKDEFAQRRNQYVDYLTKYQNLYFSSQYSLSEKSQVKDLRSLSNKIADSISSNECFISIIPSSMTSFMAPDVPYTFRQNSDFLYLTGFKETNSVLIISRTNQGSSFRTALFVREKNPKTELWEGPMTGTAQVSKLCGISDAFSIDDFKTYLMSLYKESNKNNRLVLWRYPTDHVVNQESGPNCFNSKVESEIDNFVDEVKSISNSLIVMNELEALNSSLAASYFNSSRYFVQLCRLKKSTAELEIMRDACEISSKAFLNSMKISHPYINEHLLYSQFEHDCRIRGSEHLAYIPVIAGGSRATTLHYIRNNQIIKNDSLVLMDAGCQYRDYVSDITRAWPVGGSFKSHQRELYEACLNVQKYCLSLCRPGISIHKLFNSMMRKLSEELANLGIVDKKEHELFIKPGDLPSDSLPMHYMKKLMDICPHDVGHYLGIDVHDIPELAKDIYLEPGTVITIEPGIYIRSDNESVSRKYRGIGIRIEDDVLITETGCEVLSKSCPKEIDQIEKILN